MKRKLTLDEFDLEATQVREAMDTVFDLLEIAMGKPRKGREADRLGYALIILRQVVEVMEEE